MSDGRLFDGSNGNFATDKLENTIAIKKRFKNYTPDDATFYCLEPNKMFPYGTFERFIVDTVNALNLDKFEYCNKDNGGNDEYNPKSILGILFYGFTKGIFSSRTLEVLCKYDARYIFVSGNNTPEHSTISRFITKYTDEIAELFSQILYIAINSKYVDYNMIVTDGTKIRANASEKFCGTIEDFKKRKTKLEQKIIKAIEKQKNADNKEISDYWENKAERYNKEKEKISAFLIEANEVYTKKNTEIQQNITDNDCRIMKESDRGFIQGYNAQISVCEKNGLIVSSIISNCASDKELFKVMVEKTRDLAPNDANEVFKESKFLNDNGYYSIDNLIYCSENNLDAYISDKQDKNIFIEKNEITEQEFNNGCKKEGEDIFCKNGRKLKFKWVREKEGDVYRIYKIENITDCVDCENYENCTGKNKEKEFWIKEKILNNFDKIIKMKEKLRTDEGRMTYSRRMPTVEKIFGYIKEILRFRRFTVRGKKKVEVQWNMLCTIYNLRRLFTLNS